LFGAVVSSCVLVLYCEDSYLIPHSIHLLFGALYLSSYFTLPPLFQVEQLSSLPCTRSKLLKSFPEPYSGGIQALMPVALAAMNLELYYLVAAYLELLEEDRDFVLKKVAQQPEIVALKRRIVEPA
jgi:hypothetical protein